MEATATLPKAKRPAVKFTEIILHQRPHLDEIFAVFLLRMFGTMFYGISKAQIIFWGRNELPEGKTADDLEKEGKLLVGIGGGRFDEHPTVGGNGKDGECAATLVAKALGVLEYPELELLMRFVRNTDAGKGQAFDLAWLVKLRHAANPDSSRKILDWGLAVIRDIYKEQVKFHSLAKSDFEKGTLRTIMAGNRSFQCVTVTTDNEQVGKFARSRGVPITIQKNSRGNVQIFTDEREGLCLGDVVKAIRAEEALCRDISVEQASLGLRGTIMEIPCWFYHQKGEMFLNGSLSHPEVEATKLPLEDIVDIVAENIKFK